MSRTKPEDRQRGGVRHIPDVVKEAHIANEFKTIELLGLPFLNIVTDDTGYDILVTNEGDLIYTPTEG